MNRSVIPILLVLLAAVSGAAATAPGAHGNPAPGLDDKVAEFQVRDVTLNAALAGPQAWLADLSLGFIRDDGPAAPAVLPKKISLSLKDTTVRGVFDALVGAEPAYHWQQDGGAIDFAPLRSDPEHIDAVAVLERRLATFAVENDDMNEAVAELVEQARAQGIEGLRGPVRPRSSGETAGWFSDEEKMTLSLENKSVRECLNAIIAADHPARWAAVPFQDYVVITAIPSHRHAYKHKNLSPDESAALKKKYPDPAPKWFRDLDASGDAPVSR